MTVPPELWSEQDQTTKHLGVLIRAAWQHASTVDAERAELDAKLHDATARALRAEVGRAQAHAESVHARAAVDELKTVFKRWFLDAHQGLSFDDFAKGIARDLQGVLDIADDKPSFDDTDARLKIAEGLKLPELAMEQIRKAGEW